MEKITNPFFARLFFIVKLPMAWLAGLRIRELSDKKAIVSVPFKYLTKNPFRSTYFACLSMAAELSTGVLALQAIKNSSQKVSMLVTANSSEFYKKAVTRTYFTCSEGATIIETIEKAIQTGEGQSITVSSTGTDKHGNAIANFKFEWSFKVKSKP